MNRHCLPSRRERGAPPFRYRVAGGGPLLVGVLVGSIALLADWFLRFTFWGGGRRGGDNDRGGGGGAAALIFVLGWPLEKLRTVRPGRLAKRWRAGPPGVPGGRAFGARRSSSSRRGRPFERARRSFVRCE